MNTQGIILDEGVQGYVEELNKDEDIDSPFLDDDIEFMGGYVFPDVVNIGPSNMVLNQFPEESSEDLSASLSDDCFFEGANFNFDVMLNPEIEQPFEGKIVSTFYDPR